jgi:hypothetical protein
MSGLQEEVELKIEDALYDLLGLKTAMNTTLDVFSFSSFFTSPTC